MNIETTIKAKLQSLFIASEKQKTKLTIGFNSDENEYFEAYNFIENTDQLVRTVTDLVVDQEYNFNLKVKVIQNCDGTTEVKYILIGWSK